MGPGLVALTQTRDIVQMRAICVGGPVVSAVVGYVFYRQTRLHCFDWGHLCGWASSPFCSVGCLLQDRYDLVYRFPHKSQSMKCPGFVFFFCYCFDIDACYLEITLLFEWA